MAIKLFNGVFVAEMTVHVLLSSLTYLAAKRGVQELPPFTLLGWRMGLSAATFGLLLAFLPSPRLPPRQVLGKVVGSVLRKGGLEMAILSSLWNGRLYGLEILRCLSEKSQLEVAEGTIYPILARLKAEGLLQSEWVEAEAGHPRKYYWLTVAGRRRAREMVEAWNEFSASLEVLIQPVLRGR